MRMTPIYLLFSHQDSFVNMIKYKDSCIKSVKQNIVHHHFQACYELRTHRCLVLHYSCGFLRVLPLHWSIEFLFAV